LTPLHTSRSINNMTIIQNFFGNEKEMLRDINKKNRYRITKAQRLFIEEFVKSLNIENALEKANLTSVEEKDEIKHALCKKSFQREMRLVIEEKARHLEITRAFIVQKYLEILYQTNEKKDDKALKDASLALKALEGLCKQLTNYKFDSETEQNSLSAVISGLDLNKI